MKKTPLSMEDHAAQGRELKFIRDWLAVLTVTLNRAYPLKVVNLAGRAADAVDKLRSTLDDQVGRDLPDADRQTLNRLYYPGDTAEESAPRSLPETVSLAIHRLNDLLRPGLTEAYREPLEDVVALLREGLLPGLDAQPQAAAVEGAPAALPVAQGLGNAPQAEAKTVYPKLPEDRQDRLHFIQGLQVDLGRLQFLYRDSQPEFWGLRLAWEATRFAWYVVSGDVGTAAEKLALVEDAVKDVKGLEAFKPKAGQD